MGRSSREYASDEGLHECGEERSGELQEMSRETGTEEDAETMRFRLAQTKTSRNDWNMIS